MTNPKWQERPNTAYEKYINEPAPNDDPHHKLNKDMHVEFAIIQEKLLRFGFNRGYEAALTDILKDVEGLVEGLREIKMANLPVMSLQFIADEALKLWNEKGYGK